MCRYVPRTMLLAASESAVTKKPRLRLMMRRSSSVRPFGSFHSAMSRDMLTSCGIQWFEQVARYFSHAHLYLNGTSWLTSVWPLMMRLSAADTRRVLLAAAGFAAASETVSLLNTGGAVGSAAALETTARDGEGEAMRGTDAGIGAGFAVCAFAGWTSSSQTSIARFPVIRIMRVLRGEPKHLLTSGRNSCCTFASTRACDRARARERAR